MLPFCKGHFRARLAETPQDLRAAQRLRFRAFRAERASSGSGCDLDVDDLDERCQHLLIETLSDGTLVGTCRLFLIKDAGMLDQTYATQFYDLRPLSGVDGAMLEIGRFCIAPDEKDQDALRLAWAALTRIVDAECVVLMFGCSSFPGVEASSHADALALLAHGHIGPENRRPGRKAAEAVALQAPTHDRRKAMAQMPPLLRSYLAMGGWVSDHAVLDRDLDTLHVFTGVEIAAIPPVRARLLRDDAR